MNNWVPFAFIALVLWGLWGFFPKLAANYMGARSVLVFETLGTALIGVSILISTGFNVDIHFKGITFAILTGLAGALGAFFFILSLKEGKISVVSTTTALYPLVTIGLAAVFLGEKITPKKGLGIVLALVAITLLST